MGGNYYTSITVLVWLALTGLCVLIRENHRISGVDKHLLYVTYGLIALSALAEWSGVALDGRADMPRWMLRAVKCADFILTPMSGGALVAQMRVRNRWFIAMMGLLAVNTLFQLVAAFNGWMLVIDEQSHYTHGPMYVAYMGVCLAVIAFMVIEFILYGRSFRRQNRVSLYAVMLVVVAGIAMQELLPGKPRTSYIAMTLGAAMMFIHYSEFYSLAADDHLKAQQIQIDTDALTGVLSRHAYSRALNDYDASGPLPEDFAAFSIDINGLKQANDALGHEAGDEMIIGAARCIERVLGNVGRCYRTGGDEFVVLGRISSDEARKALVNLRREADRWEGKLVPRMALSAGCALAGDHPGLTAEGLVREADMAMYAAKAAYYRENGKDRRRR